ncbi:MAG TPA: hypothetical protein VGM94_15150 [Galbitalea sp.]
MFPGAGITVHNVYDTHYRWWRRFVLLAKAQLAAREAQIRAVNATRRR